MLIFAKRKDRSSLKLSLIMKTQLYFSGKKNIQETSTYIQMSLYRITGNKLHILENKNPSRTVQKNTI